MWVQIPMALINNILKNMFMTCFDGRQLMAKKSGIKSGHALMEGTRQTERQLTAKKAASKAAAWGGIGHAGSNTNGLDKYHIKERVHNML